MTSHDAREARGERLDARERLRALKAPLGEHLDLDAVRGWEERREVSLSSAHLLPALARLTLDEPGHDDLSSPSAQGSLHWDIHGPELILGRYNHSIGPVDLSLHGLLDHELYKIAAPHLKLTLCTDEQWRLTRLSPHAKVAIDGVNVETLHKEFILPSAARLTIGIVTLRFEALAHTTLTSWTRQREDLLKTQECAAIFLKRNAGLCGPRLPLKELRDHLVGRTFPTRLSGPGRGPHTRAPIAQPDWDLSGATEHERRHIAFRHIILRPLDERDWELVPLTHRQQITLNRIDCDEPTRLQDGDEIGLGNVLFHFHHPQAMSPSTRHTIRLPNVVDWQSEHSSLIKLPPTPR